MSSELIVSGSGARGVVGQSLTPDIALEFAYAFAAFVDGGTVVVGGDTRTSHDVYKSAVISGLTASGCDVIDIGKVPTPTCQQLIRHHGAAGAIVITASHNPIIWNGLKLMNDSGSFFDQDDYARFKAIYEGKKWCLKPWDQLGTVTIDQQAIHTHLQRIFDVLDPSPIREAGLNVLIDPNHGAACDADKALLETLGVNYTILNAEGHGRFAHAPEPSEDSLKDTIAAMKDGQYDIGFVQDADADRLVILDENGRFIGEDNSLAFCIDYILGYEASDPEKESPVVVNLSTSNVIQDVAKLHGCSVAYTKIGETFVTQGIREYNAIVGGEGNGGVIFPKIGWGRDSLVGIVIALLHLAKRKQSVSEIVGSYPSYTMLREKVSLESRDQVKQMLDKVVASFPDITPITDDGIKIMFNDKWIHVRPSNTEPIIRVFVEATTAEKAQDLLNSSNLL